MSLKTLVTLIGLALLCGLMFLPGILPTLSLIAGLLIGVVVGALWREIDVRGLAIVSLSVFISVALLGLLTHTNMFIIDTALMIEAVVGSVVRWRYLPFITVADIVLGGAIGVCVAWIGGIEVSALLQRGAADNAGESLVWTPMVLLMASVPALLIFTIAWSLGWARRTFLRRPG